VIGGQSFLYFLMVYGLLLLSIIMSYDYSIESFNNAVEPLIEMSCYKKIYEL
jgi:hypothetical protein